MFMYKITIAAVYKEINLHHIRTRRLFCPFFRRRPSYPNQPLHNLSSILFFRRGVTLIRFYTNDTKIIRRICIRIARTSMAVRGGHQFNVAMKCGGQTGRHHLLVTFKIELVSWLLAVAMAVMMMMTLHGHLSWCVVTELRQLHKLLFLFSGTVAVGTMELYVRSLFFSKPSCWKLDKSKDETGGSASQPTRI